MMKKLGINLFVIFAVSIFLANFVLADQIIDNNSPNVALSGTWYTSTLVPGYYGTNYAWAYGGTTATASAQYTFQLPANGYYQVQVWHSAPYSTRSSDAPFTIYHAAGSTTVRVDQRVNGSRWNDIGTYYFLSGEARVVLTNDASGNPMADAVRMVEVTSPVADFVAAPLTGTAPLNVSFESRSAGNISDFLWNFGDGQTSTEQNPVHQYLSAGVYTVTLEVVGPEGSDLETKTNFITVTQPGAFEQIIDNGTTGFSTSGTWYTSTLVAGYYGTNYAWAYGGTTATASAQYAFQLPSNGYYQVQVWHSAPYSTRSSDAPFTIYHAAGSSTVRVDQRVNGSRWNDIGTYYFSSGQARVVLTNDASGNPVADAVKIAYVGE
jgi:PKD repeat protein